jgi:quercetin dioxygenase-like cupin family protein
LKIVNEDQLEWILADGYYRKILLSEEDLQSPGNLVQLLKVEAGSRIPPHHHQRTTEVFYVLKGQSVLFVDKNYSTRRPGDTILCRPMETHGIVNNSDNDFVLAVFKLDATEDDTYWEEKTAAKQ